MWLVRHPHRKWKLHDALAGLVDNEEDTAAIAAWFRWGEGEDDGGLGAWFVLDDARRDDGVLTARLKDFHAVADGLADLDSDLASLAHGDGTEGQARGLDDDVADELGGDANTDEGEGFEVSIESDHSLEPTGLHVFGKRELDIPTEWAVLFIKGRYGDLHFLGLRDMAYELHLFVAPTIDAKATRGLSAVGEVAEVDVLCLDPPDRVDLPFHKKLEFGLIGVVALDDDVLLDWPLRSGRVEDKSQLRKLTGTQGAVVEFEFDAPAGCLDFRDSQREVSCVADLQDFAVFVALIAFAEVPACCRNFYAGCLDLCPK